MQILLTGVAGFIGSHLALALLERGHEVLGIDNLNNYYDVTLKESRLVRLKQYDSFKFIKMDIADRTTVAELFREHDFTTVINLAAQPGVRYSIQNPLAYIDSNLLGFANILEGCRRAKVAHFIYASSSSVYGANTEQPSSERHPTNHPLALYGATKKANELIAHSYSSLYGLPTTGLRFFTVYGPWGRPDMAYYKFTKSILEDEPIQIFNHGESIRDFTYIDDTVEAILRIMQQPAKPNSQWDSDNPDPASSYAPYRILNIGNRDPVLLHDFVSALESALGKSATKEYLPAQPGDVPTTSADIRALEAEYQFTPGTSISAGLEKFVNWYSDYHNIKLAPKPVKNEALA